VWLLIDLITEELITPSQAHALLLRQLKERPPLGRLALEAKLLSVHQVFKVLSCCADSDARFGEASIQLGLLTVAQRDQLLGRQLSRQPSIEELVVDMQLCTLEEIAALKARARWPARRAAG